MSQRNAILKKLNKRLDRSDDLKSKAAIQSRLQGHSKNLIPRRGAIPQDQQVKLFCKEAEKVNASIVSVKSYDQIPGIVSDYLRQHQLPAQIKIAPDPRIKGLDWTASTSLMVNDGRADGDDPVSVSHAIGGVAETGTLVMTSGPESPTSLNFLPLDHIVVVRAEDIAGDYEALWDRIRQTAADQGTPGKLPRTVNWITGPSRTADIEQTLLLGAHGPQRLHIIMVDNADTPSSGA